MTRTIAYTLPFIILAACGDSARFGDHQGDSVLTPGVDSVTTTSIGGGGLSPPRPSGACDPHLWTYGLEVDTGSLAWSHCIVAGTGADASDYTSSTGSRILSAAELQDAKAAIRAVRVSDRAACGADKDRLSIAVTSGDATASYGDDFYACAHQYPRYVESAPLDDLASKLRLLAIQ